ncbi:hypothetical protein U1Q18_017844 [Sarracenia purpurea var. burkii]
MKNNYQTKRVLSRPQGAGKGKLGVSPNRFQTLSPETDDYEASFPSLSGSYSKSQGHLQARAQRSCSNIVEDALKSSALEKDLPFLKAEEPSVGDPPVFEGKGREGDVQDREEGKLAEETYTVGKAESEPEQARASEQGRSLKMKGEASDGKVLKVQRPNDGVKAAESDEILLDKGLVSEDNEIKDEEAGSSVKVPLFLSKGGVSPVQVSSGLFSPASLKCVGKYIVDEDLNRKTGSTNRDIQVVEMGQGC